MADRIYEVCFVAGRFLALAITRPLNFLFDCAGEFFRGMNSTK